MNDRSPILDNLRGEAANSSLTAVGGVDRLHLRLSITACAHIRTTSFIRVGTELVCLFYWVIPHLVACRLFTEMCGSTDEPRTTRSTRLP